MLQNILTNPLVSHGLLCDVFISFLDKNITPCIHFQWRNRKLLD